ncbi:MAG: glycosyltransferase [Bacteroidota bacterium]|nr:glycosyltransferase [Bacteroidota bacterium]
MKRGATKVAVVIPAWNDAAALRISLSQLQALDASVLGQLEVIVADGASTDETLSVLASFASIVTHVDSQADGGVYEAINRGVSRVSAPWVWVLGAGDTPMATDFRRALDVLSKTEDNVAHAFAVASDGAPEPGVPEMWIPRWGNPMHWRNTMHHQGLIAPSSWLKSNPLPTSYRVLGDYAWCLDRLQANETIHCHPEIVVAKVSRGGLSRSFNLALYREEWCVKKERLPWHILMAHVVWLPVKWAFKLCSRMRLI